MHRAPIHNADSPPAQPWFATDHLVRDLKDRSIRGGAITLVGQLIRFGIQIGSTAILARLLTPIDFGLVAMVAAFTGFLSLFKDIGLSTATIQREQITHAQVSTLFWINVALSVVLTISTAAAAPLIAWLYAEPRLVLVTIVISGTFVVSGLGIQHYALLARQMRFTSMVVIQTSAFAAGALAAIALALLGLGYWALVALGFVQCFVTTSLCWRISKWLPAPPRRCGAMRDLLAFGGNLTGANILSFGARHADNVLIGWYWGAGPLGNYSKAYSLLLLPVQQLTAPLNGVVLPALSRLQSDPQRYARCLTNSTAVLSMILAPTVVFAAVATDPIVLTILGPQWTDAIPMFRALALPAFLTSLVIIPTWIFTSLNRTDLLFRWTLLSTPVILGGFVITLHLGPLGVAHSLSASLAVMLSGMFVHAARLARTGTFPLLAAVVLPLILSAFAGVLVLLILRSELIASMASPAQLAVAMFGFGTLYGSMTLLTPKGRTLLLESRRLLRFDHISEREIILD